MDWTCCFILFDQINDVERLMEIIRDAGKENAVFVYTLADPILAEAAKKLANYMEYLTLIYFAQ